MRRNIAGRANVYYFYTYLIDRFLKVRKHCMLLCMKREVKWEPFLHCMWENEMQPLSRTKQVVLGEIANVYVQGPRNTALGYLVQKTLYTYMPH